MANQSFISGGQYSFFRVLFGAYLMVHFAHLLPWAAELFSNQGAITLAGNSPLFGIIPNILGLSDTPLVVQSLLFSAVLAAVAFAVGFADKWAAAWLLYVLICIFARNPLIANPALPYVGWMLLAHLFIAAKPFGSFSARNDLTLSQTWVFPRHIYLAGVIVLALTYSYSGYTKLLSPSWVSGDTISYVLQNPLARDHALNQLLLALPPIFLKLLTWFVLYVELFYAAMALVKGVHKWLWTGMLIVQFGFLILLNFADLTLAMLLMHLFTFNPSWLKAAKAQQVETVYYDGECGFCHGCVRFLLAEDSGGNFVFSPLGSEHFVNNVDPITRFNLPTSLVVVTDRGQIKVKSQAVAHCLRRLGGVWTVLGALLALLPKRLADFGYDMVGRVRRHIICAPQGRCPLLTPALVKRFV